MDNATMAGVQTTGHLEMRWVPVTDRHGRTRMESRWITAGARPDQVASTRPAA